MAKLNIPTRGPDFTDLFQLTYIQGNALKTRLARTNMEDISIEDVVRRAKQYCARNNLRFVFVEPAIITLDKPEGDFDEL